uniref:Uncharacterized protein n=1 Tax=Kalanchoe fedtschenkoi TaxID=63787 RepID=A0A7N0V8X2_KALFE
MNRSLRAFTFLFYCFDLLPDSLSPTSLKNLTRRSSIPLRPLYLRRLGFFQQLIFRGRTADGSRSLASSFSIHGASSLIDKTAESAGATHDGGLFAPASQEQPRFSEEFVECFWFREQRCVR